MTIETTFGEAKPTYYVMREGGLAPTKDHKSRFAAEKEAERLAKRTPGGTFHVLKLKKTITNTDPSAAQQTDAKKLQELARQHEIAAGLSVGDEVKIVDTHVYFADQVGSIAKIHNTGADVSPQIFVDLTEVGVVQRFQPSSLIPTGKAKLNWPDDGGLKEPVRPFGAGASIFETIREEVTGKKPRELRCGDIVAYMERGVERQGEIKQQLPRADGATQYTVRDIIDNIVMPHRYVAADLRLETKVEDRPETVAKACDAPEQAGPPPLDEFINSLFDQIFGKPSSAKAAKPAINPNYPGKALAVGSDCYVITRMIGSFGGLAEKAKVVSQGDSPTHVICLIEGNDLPQKVSASRVFDVSDKHLHILRM